MRLQRLLVFALFTAVSSAGRAEISPREAQRYCVDIALLKGGVELRGTVLSRDDKNLKLVIQRDWLTAKQPQLARQLDAEAIKAQAASRKELIQRIHLWKKQRAEDQRLTGAINSELLRLSQPAPREPPTASQFLVVTIPVDRVRRVYDAIPQSRQLGMVAWQLRLPKVEETAFGPLKLVVENQSPNWLTTTVDLSDRLPMGEPQSDQEWAARQAIYEYEYRQKLDFQGTGNLVYQVGEGAAPPALSDLLAQTVGDALQDELGGLDLKVLGLEGLEFGPKPSSKPTKSDWQQTAIAQACKLDCRGFRVTRLLNISGEGPSTVEIHLFARMTDREFRVIWFKEFTTDPASIKQSDLERVQQDPQVQQILKVAQALSVGQDAEQAVRVGAAVQASMRQGEDQFFAFRSRYNDTLDGPIFIVPNGK